jgi:hypothetical protein
VECFCGCGQKVRRFPLGLRSINTRGAIIASDVQRVEVMLDRGLKSLNAEVFVGEGHMWMEKLALAVHDRQDAGPEVEAGTREFMQEGRERFGDAALGAAVRESGMNEKEAIDALIRGEFDPFAD